VRSPLRRCPTRWAAHREDAIAIDIGTAAKPACIGVDPAVVRHRPVGEKDEDAAGEPGGRVAGPCLCGEARARGDGDVRVFRNAYDLREPRLPSTNERLRQRECSRRRALDASELIAPDRPVRDRVDVHRGCSGRVGLGDAGRAPDHDEIVRRERRPRTDRSADREAGRARVRVRGERRVRVDDQIGLPRREGARVPVPGPERIRFGLRGGRPREGEENEESLKPKRTTKIDHLFTDIRKGIAVKFAYERPRSFRCVRRGHPARTRRSRRATTR
jgi:hypothetical protein